MLGSAAKLVAETLFVLGRIAERFSRELTPREVKERYARNLAPHYPNADRVCVVCRRRETTCDFRTLCPGTDAQQLARQELRHGYEKLSG